MTYIYLKFNTVSFSYDSSAEQLFADISFHIDPGWTGIVGANGTGKSTLLKLATGILLPEKGTIEHPKELIYCEQRTDNPPYMITDFMASDSREAGILKEQLMINKDWGMRWDTLSHGERKRIQLGIALWLGPDLLAVDEPTNHLDSYASGLIYNALSEYKGIGLLVSHDRRLLDKLCSSCIFTMPPSIVMRPGGVTQATEAVNREKQTVQRQYDIKKTALKKAKRTAVKSREEAQQKQAEYRRTRRNMAPKDNDARAKLRGVKLKGKIGHAEAVSRQQQEKLNRLGQEFSSIKIEKRRTLGIWLPGSVSRRDHVLQMESGTIDMGGGKILSYPDLYVRSAERIAVTGPNGAGKSTIIKLLLTQLNVEPEHVTYVPQEIDAGDSRQILDRARALPGDRLGHLMSVVSCLNSRPERLLYSSEPSPGEIRKLLLALGMSHEPHVIIMDEPTNHLDLPSIGCLEEALSGCPCAMILVSHDEYFLKRLTSVNWNLVPDEDGTSFKLVNY